MSAWQPIETAPKDGTVIDLWVDDPQWGATRECDMRWIKHTRYYRNGRTEDVEGWGWPGLDEPDFLSDGKPTHWMPVPEPPA